MPANERPGQIKDGLAVIYINQPEFYRRTAEDEAIISGLIERRVETLGRCDDYNNAHRIAAWAKAFNDFFRDYQHMLAWHGELANKYGIVLHYKRGAIR